MRYFISAVCCAAAAVALAVPVPVFASDAPTPAPSQCPTSTSGTPLGPRALKKVLRTAGFTGESKKVAWAIVMRESRAVPTAVSPTNSNGTCDWGLFQLNDVHRATFDFSQVLDPHVNASYAFSLSASGTDFSAWAVGSKGWAGFLKRNNPALWKMYRDNLRMWMAQYPPPRR